jgi:hypothetical protein
MGGVSTKNAMALKISFLKMNEMAFLLYSIFQKYSLLHPGSMSAPSLFSLLDLTTPPGPPS